MPRTINQKAKVLYVMRLLLQESDENHPLSTEEIIDKLGEALLSTDKFGYLLPFEAVSVLLLACIIGGVVIARKR